MLDIVLGAQYGDEGKGRIVDHLCSTGEYNVTARVNGSDNAGHTIMFEGNKFAFNQIPIGAAYGMVCIIGRGCILDLDKLEDEIKKVEKMNDYWVLYLDDRCHIKTSEHRRKDGYEESRRSEPIGTTLSGNGPAYSDKYARKNLRLCDMNIDKYHNIRRKAVLIDTSLFLSSPYCGSVLAEGAHGIMLDIDHGTYPFVTSSGCTSGAACHSLGIAPHKVGRVIGVVKPYITRVGAGAFPTEILDTKLFKIASRIREVGGEYGTNTGRPRRIAWLDLQALVHSVRAGGITEIALTKIDILNELRLDAIKVCVGYEGISKGYIPPKDADYRMVDPIYVSIKWDGYGESRLIDLIEEHTRVPITIISSGVGRGAIKNRLTQNRTRE